jgi:hypothetical protein
MMIRLPPSIHIVALVTAAWWAPACSDDGQPTPARDGAAERTTDLGVADVSSSEPARDLASADAAAGVADSASAADQAAGGLDIVAVDGKARTVTGEGCHSVNFGGLVTPARLVAAPVFSGGNVSDGTYDAYAEEAGFNSPERTATTIKFEGTSFFWVRFLESSTNRNDFEERSRGTYSVSGNMLSLAGNCGSTVVRQYSFSAMGDELLLYQEGLLRRLRRR